MWKIGSIGTAVCRKPQKNIWVDLLNVLRASHCVSNRYDPNKRLCGSYLNSSRSQQADRVCIRQLASVAISISLAKQIACVHNHNVNYESAETRH
jgi:hypothetical protein